jgi:hypothetical protein
MSDDDNDDEEYTFEGDGDTDHLRRTNHTTAAAAIHNEEEEDDEDDIPLKSFKKPSSRQQKQKRPQRTSAHVAATRIKIEHSSDDAAVDDDEEEEFEQPSKKTKKTVPKVRTSAKPKKTQVVEAAASSQRTSSSSHSSNIKKRRSNNSSSGTQEEDDSVRPDGIVSSNTHKNNSSSSSPHKKKKLDTTTTTTTTTTPRELKKLDKTERLQYAMQAFLWWNAPEPAPGCQWTTMEHAGVAFPEPYVPHAIPIQYRNQPVILTPLQEEAATLFASIDPDGMHLGNTKTAPIFIKNFFEDFQLLLGKKHIVQEYRHCNFDAIRQHLQTKKMITKAATDAERKATKSDRCDTLHHFGYAIVDQHIERVGNYNMEPPGTFRGRGIHPKMGKLKARVVPEQVSINVSECAPIPKCPVPGHAWGDIKHDPAGQWLATWKENINNQVCHLCVCVCVPMVGCVFSKMKRNHYSLHFVCHSLLSHSAYRNSRNICNWQHNRPSRVNQIEPSTTRRRYYVRILSRYVNRTRRI